MKGYSIPGLFYLFFCIILTRILFYPSRLIRLPIQIRGKKFIKFGKGFTTGCYCRLDAFPINNSSPYCLEFGDNCQINDNVHIASIQSVKIMDNVLIASKVFISDHNHGSYGKNEIHSSPVETPAERQLFSSPVVINKNVWIGEFVSILPGVTIGEGAVIGTMSVVTSDIPSYTIAVGAPAVPIKKYNFKSKKWIYIK